MRIDILDPFLLSRAQGQLEKLSRPGDVHHLLVTIAGIFSEAEDAEISLMDFLELVLSKYGVSRPVPIDDDAGRRVLFAAMCWLTSTLTPSKDISPNALCISILPKQSGFRRQHRMDDASRPVAKFLRGFGNILPSADLRVAQGQQSELLHASVLNFYSLSTVGKVNIQWVDTLSAHLEFHSLSRTLMLYRFPTMCALHCLGDEELHCANRLLRSYYPTCSNSTVVLTALRREILLSYRSLFGQSYRSRQLFNVGERKRAHGSGHYDPVLSIFCGESHRKSLKALPSELWPESCRDSVSQGTC
ncbi:hypothetical protein K402DRAFT_182852 [Aulographum hederae CBS 113979]|uniref:Uncharacterized protein n=1 Tax=Aulographum hederae CBS 113979 TaxID=1176131 RepID=A0A6G1GQS4_9PEZI|nr:hypothetical protein K402DRAFT_182852 [Aulographum hederae CBS 113979]